MAPRANQIWIGKSECGSLEVGNCNIHSQAKTTNHLSNAILAVACMYYSWSVNQQNLFWVKPQCSNVFKSHEITGLVNIMFPFLMCMFIYYRVITCYNLLFFGNAFIEPTWTGRPLVDGDPYRCWPAGPLLSSCGGGCGWASGSQAAEIRNQETWCHWNIGWFSARFCGCLLMFIAFYCTLMQNDM